MQKSVLTLGAACAAVSLSAASVQGQGLLIPDSSADSIGLYDATDGSLINANFIVDANDDATYNFSTPKEAIQVGSEIWVSDQLADSIFIFDLSGSYLTKIDSGLDNIRGLAAVDGTVYIANGGGNNGAPDDTIVTIDAATRAITGNFGFGPPNFSPFDVSVYNGVLLVSDIDGGGSSQPLNTEGVDAFELDGSYIGRIVSVSTSDSTLGPDFPQQVSGKLSDDNILVAGFSTPAGVYEFDEFGTQVGLFAEDAGQRGVFELLDGNYVYTTGGGTFVLDPTTDTSTLVGDGSQYIAPTTIPEPATLGLAALGGLGLLRRRK